MATKKSFKAELNPALQFISIPEPEDTPITAPKRPTPSTHKTKTKDTEQQSKIPQGKTSQSKPPEGYKFNPQYLETKSKRVQLLMQPSLYDKVKTQANTEGLSVNEWIHSKLDETTQAR